MIFFAKKFGACLLFFLLSCAATKNTTDLYDVSQAKPVAVGMSYAILADLSFSQESHGHITENKIHFDATATVQEINTKKRPVKIHFKIKKFIKKSNNQETVLLNSDEILVQNLNDAQHVFTVNNQPVLSFVEKALQAFLSEKGVFDEIFGTNIKRKVGEKWPIDQKAYADLFKNKPITFKPEGISGTVEFVKVFKKDGHTYLHLTNTVKSNQFEAQENQPLLIENFDLRSSFDVIISQEVDFHHKIFKTQMISDVAGKTPSTGEAFTAKQIVEMTLEVKEIK